MVGTITAEEWGLFSALVPFLVAVTKFLRKATQPRKGLFYLSRRRGYHDTRKMKCHLTRGLHSGVEMNVDISLLSAFYAVGYYTWGNGAPGIQDGSSLPSESFLETLPEMHPKVCFHSDSTSSRQWSLAIRSKWPYPKYAPPISDACCIHSCRETIQKKSGRNVHSDFCEGNEETRCWAELRWGDW